MKGVLWQSPESRFIRIGQNVYWRQKKKSLKITLFILLPHFPVVNELTIHNHAHTISHKSILVTHNPAHTRHAHRPSALTLICVGIIITEKYLCEFSRCRQQASFAPIICVKEIMREGVIKFNGLSGTVDSEGHVVKISRGEMNAIELTHGSVFWN